MDLETEITAGVKEAKMKLAILKNAIAEAKYQMMLDIPIELTDSGKTANSNEWRSYRERTEKLITHRGQAFSLILGQCTRLLQDKMKQDTDWLTGP
jgi:transposase